MNVVVNGLMTNYQLAGSCQKTLVMLHGWGDSLSTFEPLVSILKDKYKILSLDLPGFGGTQVPDKAWDLATYAEFVAAWLKKIDVKKVDALIGHSYGGSIAIKAVGEDLIKPENLILVSSSGIRGVYRLRKVALKGAAKIVKQPLRLLPPRVQRRIKRKAYGAIGSEVMLLPHMELTFKRMIGEDLQQTAQKIKIPTLLIYGNSDKTTPVKYGSLFQKAIAGSILKTIEGGHFVHQEDPKDVADLIEVFLSKKEAASAV